MSKQTYFVLFGCDGCGHDSLIIQADSKSQADECAYAFAREYFEGYAGSQGILSYEQFCAEDYEEDPFQATDYPDMYEEYDAYVDEMLVYRAEPFDMENEEHLSTLNDCLGDIYDWE